MYIFYIEESGLSGLNKIYSAMGIPDVLWQRLLNELISSRRDLKNTYGIKARKELHAFKLINGRGNYGDRKFTQQELVDIYRRALAPIADYPEIRIMNAIGPDRRSETILEYLINRIEKFLTVNNDYGLLIFDNGENKKILRKIRMMRRHNPIPSQYNAGWGNDEYFRSNHGTSYRNFPILRIIEDANFRDSRESYFIQIVDLIAYALLRKEVPTEKFRQCGFVDMFSMLSPCFVREANKKDQYGIIRVN